MLTVHECAARLGVDPWTVRRYIREGRLPAARYGAIWLIQEADLAAFQKPPHGWPRGKPRKQKAESD